MAQGLINDYAGTQRTIDYITLTDANIETPAAPTEVPARRIPPPARPPTGNLASNAPQATLATPPRAPAR